MTFAYIADDMFTCIWKEHKLNLFVINQIKNDLTIDATFVYLQEMGLFWISSNKLGLHEKSALTSRLSKDRYHVHYIVIHSWHCHVEWKVNVCVYIISARMRLQLSVWVTVYLFSMWPWPRQSLRKNFPHTFKEFVWTRTCKRCNFCVYTRGNIHITCVYIDLRIIRFSRIHF